MRVHTDNVPNYTGTLDDLATAIGNMRFDALAKFVGLLADELSRQAKSDWDRNRRRLSARLDCAVMDLHDVQYHVADAWKICEPFMKDDHETAVASKTGQP